MKSTFDEFGILVEFPVAGNAPEQVYLLVEVEGLEAAGGLRNQLNRMPLQSLHVQAVNGAAEGHHPPFFVDLPAHQDYVEALQPRQHAHWAAPRVPQSQLPIHTQLLQL